MIALAINRWARSLPDTKLGDGGYTSSRDVEAALLGDGLIVETNIDLTDQGADVGSDRGFKRITAAEGSVGFDKNLSITKVGDGRYLVKIVTATAK